MKNRARDVAKRKVEEAGGQLMQFRELLKKVEVEGMAREEQEVMVDCNRVAFWRYSVPLVVASWGATLLLARVGVTRGTHRLARYLGAGLTAYLAGQLVYLRSSDCTAR